VRTSPDHGTAFEIAGTGRARIASLVACAQARGAAGHCRRDGAGQMTRRPNAADGLPPLRDVIRRHDLSAASRSAEFLLDLNLTGRIARAAARSRASRHRGRAGSGRTDARAATEGAARVMAIERDDRAIGALRNQRHYPDRLTVIGDDAPLRRQAAAGRPAARVRRATLPTISRTACSISWLTAEPWPPWYAAWC